MLYPLPLPPVSPTVWPTVLVSHLNVARTWGAYPMYFLRDIDILTAVVAPEAGEQLVKDIFILCILHGVGFGKHFVSVFLCL